MPFVNLAEPNDRSSRDLILSREKPRAASRKIAGTRRGTFNYSRIQLPRARFSQRFCNRGQHKKSLSREIRKFLLRSVCINSLEETLILCSMIPSDDGYRATYNTLFNYPLCRDKSRNRQRSDPGLYV